MLSTCFKRARVRPSLNGLKSRAVGGRRKWLWSHAESNVCLTTRVLLITVTEMSVTWKPERGKEKKKTKTQDVFSSVSAVLWPVQKSAVFVQIFKPSLEN